MRMKRTLKVCKKTLKRWQHFPWNDLASLGKEIAVTLFAKGFSESSNDREHNKKIQRLGEKTYQFYLDNRDRFPYRVRTFFKFFQDLQHRDLPEFKEEAFKEPPALPHFEDSEFRTFEIKKPLAAHTEKRLIETPSSYSDATETDDEKDQTSTTARLEIELSITGVTPEIAVEKAEIAEAVEEKPSQKKTETKKKPTTGKKSAKTSKDTTKKKKTSAKKATTPQKKTTKAKSSKTKDAKKAKTATKSTKKKTSTKKTTAKSTKKTSPSKNKAASKSTRKKSAAKKATTDKAK